MDNGYGYLPELHGLTEIEQQGVRKQYGQARQNLNRASKRSGARNSGAYLGAMANLEGGEASVLTDVERKNMYQNSMLRLQDRRTQEREQFQKQEEEDQWKRKMDEMNKQKQTQWEQELGGAAGTIAGTFLGPLAGMGAGALARNIGWKQTPEQETEQWKQMMKMLGLGGGEEESQAEIAAQSYGGGAGTGSQYSFAKGA